MFMFTLTVMGLGPGDPSLLTLRAAQMLKSGAKVFLRTERHGIRQWLEKEGIPYESMDELYEACRDFDELDEKIVQRIQDALGSSDVIYAVPNSGDASDSSILALAATGIPYTFIPGIAQDTVLLGQASATGINVRQDRLQRCTATAMESFEPNVWELLLITELENPILTGEVKISLLEYYRDDHPTFLLTKDGMQEIVLSQLDMQKGLDHTACVLIPPVSDLRELSRYGFRDVKEVVNVLRAPGGCPWDAAQDHHSIEEYLLEEAYEARDAIRREDIAASVEELGDLLFQVVFHAQIAQQYEEYDLRDITTEVCDKMIRRHPHVFRDPGKENDWEKVKNEEKGFRSVSDTLGDVPRTMPAFVRMQKLQKRTKLMDNIQETEKALIQAAQRLLQTGKKEDAIVFLYWLCNEARLKKCNLEMEMLDLCERFCEIYEKEEASITDAQVLTEKLFSDL